MDTSETYRKMCQMAVKEHPETFGRNYFDSHDYTFKVEGNDLLWPLFRQDQLQAMRIAHRYRDEEQLPVNATVADLDFFQDWILNDCTGLDWSYRGEVTREQLEIAFYMKEVHGKLWTGDRWKGEHPSHLILQATENQSLKEVTKQAHDIVEDSLKGVDNGREEAEAAHAEAQARDSGRGWGSTGSGI